VLLGALDVINCIIAVSSDPVVQYLVERDVVNLVLPLSSHAYSYVRMQALWILGNMGTITFKDQVVRPKVIDAIVQVRINCFLDLTVTVNFAPSLLELRNSWRV
jgi:hypothetical protein